MKRRKMNRGKSKRYFRNNAGVKRTNREIRTVKRGGWRM
jgi:hypothetical protein